MKKLIVAAVLVAGTLSLAGCSTDRGNTTVGEDTSASVEKAEQTSETPVNPNPAFEDSFDVVYAVGHVPVYTDAKSNADILGVYSSGSEIRPEQYRSDGWYSISLESGTTGYIREADISFTAPETIVTDGFVAVDLPIGNPEDEISEEVIGEAISTEGSGTYRPLPAATTEQIPDIAWEDTEEGTYDNTIQPEESNYPFFDPTQQ